MVWSALQAKTLVGVSAGEGPNRGHPCRRGSVTIGYRRGGPLRDRRSFWGTPPKRLLLSPRGLVRPSVLCEPSQYRPVTVARALPFVDQLQESLRLGPSDTGPPQGVRGSEGSHGNTPRLIAMQALEIMIVNNQKYVTISGKNRAWDYV